MIEETKFLENKERFSIHKSKALFSTNDPIKPASPTNTQTSPCLKNIMIRLSKDCMLIGQKIRVDEHDIAFQGKHRDK